ncbi:MAG: sigma-54 dependent transcriptional regulator [Planctomycetota bacterium]
MSERKDGETVLVVDDEPISLDYLREAFLAFDVRVECARDGDEACTVLAKQAIDYVFTDLQMPGRDGLAVLAAAKAADRERPVVLVTAHGTMAVAIDAMRAGADDILEKPVSLEELELALLRARDRRRLLRQNRFWRDCNVGDDLVVAGPATRAVVELAERAAPTDAPVVVFGESGTGKERVAALLHRRSRRGDGPFVKVNCAAVPEALLESEFFGHEAGAYTGAGRRRLGLFELADGGTLFLDEIGEMPLALQAKLLRVLQDGEVMRLGAERPRKVDVRVVCATNRDLRADVESGRFRADLLFRLHVVAIELPPLRSRRDEIVPLARHFVHDLVDVSPEAAEVLRAHSWPGNVRELQNVLQRVLVLADGRLDPAILARELSGAPRTAHVLPTADGLVGDTLRSVEERVIRATLQHCGGNRTRAAKMLGIGVRTLFNKLALLNDMAQLNVEGVRGRSGIDSQPVDRNRPRMTP